MKDKGLKVLAHIASNPIKWTLGLGAAGIAQSLYSKRKKKKEQKQSYKKYKGQGRWFLNFLKCLNQKD